MEPSETLTVFGIGPDYLAANGEQDAWDIFLTQHDDVRENWATTDMCRISDDQVLRCYVDEHGNISDSGIVLSMTAREWANKYGRGFLFSDEY